MKTFNKFYFIFLLMLLSVDLSSKEIADLCMMCLISPSGEVLYTPKREGLNKKEIMLVDKGYMRAIQHFNILFEENTIYKALYGEGKRKSKFLKFEKDGIFYWAFLLENELNHVIQARVINNLGEEISYYKININNEPATYWIKQDIDGDGLIEDDEGYYVWY